MRQILFAVCAWLLAVQGVVPAVEEGLPGTEPLAPSDGRDAQMRQGIDALAERLLREAAAERPRWWQRDLSSPAAYEQAVAPNRERLRRMLGAVDARLPAGELELCATLSRPALVAVSGEVEIRAVRWQVLHGVQAEGLLLSPPHPRASVVALPDADQPPEQLAGLVEGHTRQAPWALELAQRGCQVLIPTLIDRRDEHSGHPDVWFTNQPHREWVYRPAFECGRHVIGYEILVVEAALDHLAKLVPGTPLGVAGYGEGGLLAFYAAALDTRISAALVSGYFGPRERLWEEPIYRNVFGLLQEFGDAEIASLIAPRALIVEYAEMPPIDGPPPAREGRRAVAAPGRLITPSYAEVRAEAERARGFFSAQQAVKLPLVLIAGEDGQPVGPGSDQALKAFLDNLGLQAAGTPLSSLTPTVLVPASKEQIVARHDRLLAQLVAYNESLLGEAVVARARYWSRADRSSLAAWQATCADYRRQFWEEVLGKLPAPTVPPRPRSRLLQQTAAWTSYEVVLDVYPEVFCWGILLVPRDLAEGERRPVVVCQHGLEGLPEDVVNQDPASAAFQVYRGFAAELAERGFVTFAPHNPYRGGNEFRQLQRKLYPLKKTLFSVIVAQHQRHLEWLASLPFVDAQRIAFYGLSYGGFTAIRVPPLLEGYALSISSAEFNEMLRKKASTRDAYSYPFHGTYEVFEFNLANTFGYAELAGLMAPRPFMVERGHKDGVAPDEWVAAEYARVRRLYAELGIAERTEIEFFDGGHEIHGQGTYRFLHRHLGWPEPPSAGPSTGRVE